MQLSVASSGSHRRWSGGAVERWTCFRGSGQSPCRFRARCEPGDRPSGASICVATCWGPAPDFCARSVRPGRSDLRTRDRAELPGTVDLACSGADLELRPDRSDGAI